MGSVVQALEAKIANLQDENSRLAAYLLSAEDKATKVISDMNKRILELEDELMIARARAFGE